MRRAKNVEIFYRRQNGRCFYCGEKCCDETRDWLLAHRVRMEIEHCTPVKRYDSASNIAELCDPTLVGACRRCNHAKGIRTSEEFRWHRKLQRRELNWEFWGDRFLFAKKLKRDWFCIYSQNFIPKLLAHCPGVYGHDR
jgi:5-methylcytosine-specific restriction endonuclease McrA